MTEDLIAELGKLADGAERVESISATIRVSTLRQAIAALSAQQAGEPTPCFECGGTEFADRVCLGCNVIEDRNPAVSAPDAVRKQRSVIGERFRTPAPDAAGWWVDCPKCKGTGRLHGHRAICRSDRRSTSSSGFR